MLEKFNKLTEKQKTLIALGFFALLVVLFYGNTLANGFVYDDHQQVEENVYLQSLRWAPKVFTSCIWESAFGSCSDRGVSYYRPVQSLSYLATFQISSHPGFFHAVNMLYFLIAGFLVYLVGRRLTGSVPFAFFAGLIFLTHPIGNESVNWISAVPELALVIFVLASTLFYMKDRSSFAASQREDPPALGHKNLILAVLFYFAAMLSKEPAVLLPFIFVFLDVSMFRMPFAYFLSLGALKRYGAFAGAALLYLVMRFAVLGGSGSGSAFYESFSAGERVHAFFTLFSQYLVKLVYPLPLLFFYSFEKQSDFSNVAFWGALIVAVAFVVIFVVAIQQKRTVLAFSLFWIALFLLPVLLFLESLNEALFSERYLFLSSVGFAFLTSYALMFLWRLGYGGRYGVAALVGVFVIASLVVTLPRNTDWKNDESIYVDTLAKNESAYPIRFNWAVLLRNQKQDFEGARVEFETILEQNPDWRDTTMVLLHLGDYYRDVAADEQKAIEYYKRSTEVARDWKSNFAFNRLGGIYAARGEYINALPYYCQATQTGGPNGQASDERLARVIDSAVTEYEDKPGALYDAVINAGAFQKSEPSKVRYSRKNCEDETCSFFFSLGAEEDEIILPFLITVTTESGLSVEITGLGLSPTGEEAMLQVSSEYENEALSFLFPTCDGIYYEAVVSN